MKYIIIEKSTLREAIKKMVKKKLRPLTIEEIWKLKKEGKIEKGWYDTGTLWYQGKFQQITFKQMKDIENIYEKEGRLLRLGDFDYLGLDGDGILDYGARVLGIRVKIKEEK